jgi:hypothetical protein
MAVAPEHPLDALDTGRFARGAKFCALGRWYDGLRMLALHLLQNCMVYVNTLMLQQILDQPCWQGQLTATDLRALTLLIWEHVNPYGRLDLDMSIRLPIK